MKKLLILISLFIIITNSTFAQDKNLCQGNYYEEEEGARLLKETQQKITSKKEWEDYTDVIREGILTGTELDPLPEKSLLNVIRKDLRNYGAYTVENIAF